MQQLKQEQSNIELANHIFVYDWSINKRELDMINNLSLLNLLSKPKPDDKSDISTPVYNFFQK